MSKFKVGDIVEFCGKSYILVNKISYILNLWHALSINDVIDKKNQTGFKSFKGRFYKT